MSGPALDFGGAQTFKAEPDRSGTSPSMTLSLNERSANATRPYPTFSIFLCPPMYGTSASGSVTEPSAS